MSAATFVRRPAWRIWCDLVSRESRGQATVAEEQLLRDPANLIAWMRALNQIKSDVEAKMADGRLRLSALKPLPGERPTAEYLLAKAQNDRHSAGRVRVHRGVCARLEECRHLLDCADIDPKFTVGALTAALLRAEELLTLDDVEGALGAVRVALGRR